MSKQVEKIKELIAKREQARREGHREAACTWQIYRS